MAHLPTDDAKTRKVSAAATLALISGLAAWYSQVFTGAGAGKFVGVACCLAGLAFSARFGMRLLSGREEEARGRIIFRSIMAFPVLLVLGFAFFGVLSALGLERNAPLGVVLGVTVFYISCCLVGVALSVRVDTELSLTSIRQFKPRLLFGIVVGFPIFFLAALVSFGVLYLIGPRVVAWMGIGAGLCGLGHVGLSSGRWGGGSRCVAGILLGAAFLLFVPRCDFPTTGWAAVRHGLWPSHEAPPEVGLHVVEADSGHC